MAKNFPKCVNDKDPLNSRSLVESCNYSPVVDHLPNIHKTMAISSNKYKKKTKQRNLDT